MFRLIFLAFAALMSWSVCAASDYKEMLRHGKTWYYATINIMSFTSYSGELVTGLDSYRITGSENVNGFDCHILECRDELNAGKVTSHYLLYESAADRKVYLVPEETCRSVDEMKLLFDFNLKEGDVVDDGFYRFNVTKDDFVKTERHAKLHRLDTGIGIWLEGVGSSDGYGMIPVVRPSNGDQRVFVGCYGENVGPVFHSDFYRETDEDALDAPMLPAAAYDPEAYYDLMGREISAPTPGTIYIHSGKAIRY